MNETESPHPVCYCFVYTEENIAREIKETGESTVVEWITDESKRKNVPVNTEIPPAGAVWVMFELPSKKR